MIPQECYVDRALPRSRRLYTITKRIKRRGLLFKSPKVSFLLAHVSKSQSSTQFGKQRGNSNSYEITISNRSRIWEEFEQSLVLICKFRDSSYSSLYNWITYTSRRPKLEVKKLFWEKIRTNLWQFIDYYLPVILACFSTNPKN